MAGSLTWLPDVLRSAGVDVYVMPGARTRTTRASGLSPQGVVWHHTATGPNWSDGHVAALLRDGRSDLDGPLAHVGIERDGTWVIVALGRANHNGFGHWGNDSIGLEFYNSGVGEPWPAVQVESGVKGTRAILAHLGKRAATAVLGHKESDPNRKIDPAGLDMSDIRRRIAAPTAPPQEDPDVDPKDWSDNGVARVEQIVVNALLSDDAKTVQRNIIKQEVPKILERMTLDEVVEAVTAAGIVDELKARL